MLQVDIDFETEPIGVGKDGKEVFFRDIWPSNEEVAKVSYMPFYDFQMVIQHIWFLMLMFSVLTWATGCTIKCAA